MSRVMLQGFIISKVEFFSSQKNQKRGLKLHFLILYLFFDTVYEKKFLDINQAFGDLKMISKDCYLRKLKSLTENIVKIIATVVV